jgi:two-component system, NtrC family, sensor kinase
MTKAPAPIVLYVDDELPNRIVFEQSFVGEFAIRVVEGPEAALAVLASIGNEVGVVVTDMRMPTMSGDQLLRRVKDRWPSTIRIVLTAYSNVEPILAAINEGLVARYLVKPWDREELAQVLRWAVEAWTFGRESQALQRRLLETERLATLGSMAGAVIHDLSQPLAGLAFNSQHLLELARASDSLRRMLNGTATPQDQNTLEELTEDLADVAKDIAAGTSHLREVCSGLRQFLRSAPAGSEPPSCAPMPVIRNAIVTCEDIAVVARGVIRYEGPSELPTVRMASTELAQVLINVVANAAQALVTGSIAGGVVTVHSSVEPKSVTFVVRDNGAGIPPEVLSKIGTPFFTTRHEGTGLGVAQCQRLVGKVGGMFRIDSEVGVGTTVTFSIPR